METAASAQIMILEKRNRKMNIGADRLKQIIVEEYLREELEDQHVEAIEDKRVNQHYYKKIKVFVCHYKFIKQLKAVCPPITTPQPIA